LIVSHAHISILVCRNKRKTKEKSSVLEDLVASLRIVRPSVGSSIVCVGPANEAGWARDMLNVVILTSLILRDSTQGIGWVISRWWCSWSAQRCLVIWENDITSSRAGACRCFHGSLVARHLVQLGQVRYVQIDMF
jgi:hypothetical protein